MRILLFLIDAYDGMGGIAQLNRHLMATLAAHPLVSEIVALPRRAESARAELPKTLTYDRSAARGRWRYVAATASRLLGDRRFDLVIATHLNLQPLAGMAARLLGVPGILLLHGIEAWKRPESALTRFFANRADLCLGVSALTLARFRDWARIAERQCRVLPCAVDLERFTPGPPSREFLDKWRLAGKRPLLTLARHAAAERYKGVDELLEAMPELLAAAPDLVYVVAGAGDDVSRLAAKAAALGIADKVRFTGYVAEEAKPALYRSARAFVLAGYGEGFGIVLLEAMASGIPVVASTRDGSSEAVRQGRLGLAVDPGDRAGLVQGVMTALERPCGVRPPGLDYFSVGAFADRVHEILSELAGRAHRAAPVGIGPCDSTT